MKNMILDVKSCIKSNFCLTISYILIYVCFYEKPNALLIRLCIHHKNITLFQVQHLLGHCHDAKACLRHCEGDSETQATSTYSVSLERINCNNI